MDEYSSDDGGDLPDDCPISQLPIHEKFLDSIDGWFDCGDTRSLALTIDLDSGWMPDSVTLTLYDQFGFKSMAAVSNRLLEDYDNDPFRLTLYERLLDSLGWALADFRDQHIGPPVEDESLQNDILGSDIGSSPGFRFSSVAKHYGSSVAKHYGK